MITPVEFRSEISQLLTLHYLNNITRGQMIKNLILKGWSYESAEMITDKLKEGADKELRRMKK